MPRSCGLRDLLTSEKEFFQDFSSIGCPHFSAKAQAKWSLNADDDQPASAVRDGVVVTHGSFLGDSLSQQIATGLQVLENAFVSRGQLILGKKDSVGRSLPVLGADFGVVRVNGIDTCFFTNSIARLTEGRWAGSLLARRTKTAECGGVNVRIPSYPGFHDRSFPGLPQGDGDFSLVVHCASGMPGGGRMKKTDSRANQRTDSVVRIPFVREEKEPV